VLKVHLCPQNDVSVCIAIVGVPMTKRIGHFLPTISKIARSMGASLDDEVSPEVLIFVKAPPSEYVGGGPADAAIIARLLFDRASDDDPNAKVHIGPK